MAITARRTGKATADQKILVEDITLKILQQRYLKGYHRRIHINPTITG